MILRNFYTNSVSWGSATSHVSSICEISAFWGHYPFPLFEHDDVFALFAFGHFTWLSSHWFCYHTVFLDTLICIPFREWVVFSHCFGLCQPLSFLGIWGCLSPSVPSDLVSHCQFGHLGLFESVSVFGSCQPLSFLGIWGCSSLSVSSGPVSHCQYLYSYEWGGWQW